MLVDEVAGHRRPRRARPGRRRIASASLALGDELDRATDAAGASCAAATAALAATVRRAWRGVTVLAIGVRLVGAGRLDGVYLALLPLAAVASFEVIPPLPRRSRCSTPTRRRRAGCSS